jgi:hypothetical protein
LILWYAKATGKAEVRKFKSTAFETHSSGASPVTIALDGTLCVRQEEAISRRQSSTAGSDIWLSGHWRRVDDEVLGVAILSSSTKPGVSSSSMVAEDWSCTACTLVNKAASPKCRTCSTPAPAKTFKAVRVGAHPGAFALQLSVDGQAMRGWWSRGETTSMWLAVREIVSAGFSFDFKSSSSAQPSADAVSRPDLMLRLSSRQGSSGYFLNVGPDFELSSFSKSAFTLELWACPDPVTCAVACTAIFFFIFLFS